MFSPLLCCTVLTVLLAGPQTTTEAPWNVEFPRQVMTVFFDKPVKVGDRILMGRYFIEHDNARMARGWPCTYLYSAKDTRLPVVAFRCRHVAGSAPARPTVIVRDVKNAIGMRELVAFQFAGEDGAHGNPTVR